jgi:hypothetical protein
MAWHWLAWPRRLIRFRACTMGRGQRRRLWNIVDSYISYFVEFRETIGSIHTYDNNCRGALATTC